MKLRKALILLSITCVYFFSMFQRVAVPGTVFNELQLTFEASAAAIAALGSIYLYIYGGMQIFTGMLADRLGSSVVLIAGGAFLAAGSVFFPLSATLNLLYVNRALVGLGASLIYISMLKHISTFFSRVNFPLVLSCSIVAGYSGGLMATYPLERMVARMGWQHAFLTAGLVCLVMVTWSAFLLRNSLTSGREKSNPFRTVKNILCNRLIYPVVFSGSANFSVYFLLQATIGKKMLEDFAGLSSSHAAAFTFWMMLTTMTSVLFHGYIGKKTGKRKKFAVITASFTVAGVILILMNLCLLSNTVLFLASYLLCAFAGGNILNPTLIKEINPDEAAGTAVGVYNGAMYFSVAVIGNLAGLVMDLFRSSAVVTPEAIIYPVQAYITIFAGCLLLGLISFVSAVMIREHPDDCR